MSLSQVLGFFLCLLDIGADFIPEVVNRILLNCFVYRLHLFLTLRLFLTVYLLRNFFYDLMTVQKILLLLVIGKNPSLKWSPLSSHFGCTSLHKFDRLRHRNHALGLDRLSLDWIRGGRRRFSSILFVTNLRDFGLLNLPAQFVRSVHHRSELATHDAVLEQNLGVVDIIVNSQLAFKKVVIQGVVEGNPVQVALSGTLLESLEWEADRAVPLLFCADPTQDNLEGGWGSSWALSKAR